MKVVHCNHCDHEGLPIMALLITRQQKVIVAPFCFSCRRGDQIFPISINPLLPVEKAADSYKEATP